MSNHNICKFVSPQDKGSLIATNFVFEACAPDCVTRKTNVLYLVESGKAILHSGTKKSKLVTGTMFFTFADLPFKIENTGNIKFYYISFYGERADELFRRFGVTPNNCVFDGFKGLIPFWQDNIVRADDENIDLLSEMLVLYAFSKLKVTENKTNDIVNFVLAYLEGHFTESSLCLSEVADAAGYHEKYLSHIFKKQFGMGFSEYLRLIRIKYALILIDNGVSSMKNVAQLSGFSDPFYFSRVFTEVMGQSPRQYKEASGDGDADDFDDLGEQNS